MLELCQWKHVGRNWRLIEHLQPSFFNHNFKVVSNFRASILYFFTISVFNPIFDRVTWEIFFISGWLRISRCLYVVIKLSKIKIQVQFLLLLLSFKNHNGAIAQKILVYRFVLFWVIVILKLGVSVWHFT